MPSPERHLRPGPPEDPGCRSRCRGSGAGRKWMRFLPHPRNAGTRGMAVRRATRGRDRSTGPAGPRRRQPTTATPPRGSPRHGDPEHRGRHHRRREPPPPAPQPGRTPSRGHGLHAATPHPTRRCCGYGGRGSGIGAQPIAPAATPNEPSARPWMAMSPSGERVGGELDHGRPVVGGRGLISRRPA